mmetsp:Transcript_104400/g.294310  ORF Transcript_104400/g.294310 Transcript_104400/m.294310 type:complete len:221 (-) Transcript_104400:369-1031(-)
MRNFRSTSRATRGAHIGTARSGIGRSPTNLPPLSTTCAPCTRSYTNGPSSGPPYKKVRLHSGSTFHRSCNTCSMHVSCCSGRIWSITSLLYQVASTKCAWSEKPAHAVKLKRAACKHLSGSISKYRPVRDPEFTSRFSKMYCAPPSYNASNTFCTSAATKRSASRRSCCVTRTYGVETDSKACFTVPNRCPKSRKNMKLTLNNAGWLFSFIARNDAQNSS